MSFPRRGEIWSVNLNPTKGHEQAGIRPALVLSVDDFNKTHAGLVVVLPITTKNRNIPLHIEISSEESGLREISYIKCENIRSVSTERLTDCIGYTSDSTLEKIEQVTRMLLSL